jgi:hypothetical protein
MEFAESWKPLMKSKIKATAIMKIKVVVLAMNFGVD